jgi:hypothetical protein
MSVITTGNHPKLLWPGLNALFGMTYKDVPLQHTEVFDVSTSEKAYEEDQELPGFGLAPVKSEGGAISYDTHAQGYTTRYSHIVYGLGFIETEEAVEDNQYKSRATSRTKALARSMRVTKETILANIINRAFDSNYTGGDGKELLATNHPSLSGDQSNELSVAADLSEASLEDLLIQIMQATDSRGLRINLMGKKLIVPPQLSFEATRIVKSALQNDTANNAVNAMKAMGMLPEGVMVWRYLTDADAWFIKTDAAEGLKLFNRRALAFEKDGDFDTGNYKHKATERYSGGWSDWRAMYGSAGL